MAADAFPLDNAVNNADEKILHPENKKLNEKMLNPFLVISKHSCYSLQISLQWFPRLAWKTEIQPKIPFKLYTCLRCQPI